MDTAGVDYVNECMRPLGLEWTALFNRWGGFNPDATPRDRRVSTAGGISNLLTLIACHEAVSSGASEDKLGILRWQDCHRLLQEASDDRRKR